MNFKTVRLLAGALVLTGCATVRPGNDCATDAWRKDWEVTVNATEQNVHKDGYVPFGWWGGELDQRVANRPPYEGRGHHVGLMLLHPLSVSEPARMVYRGEVLLSRPVLVVQAAGNVQGDCILRCVVNGHVVGDEILTGRAWSTARFDLTAFAGQDIQLELQNAAGGQDPWRFEHCFIDCVTFAGH